jgi:hypothetical protein
MQKMAIAAVAAVLIAVPVGLRAQAVHSLGDAIAAGLSHYSDARVSMLVCVRLIGPDGEDVDPPSSLPRIIQRKAPYAEAKSLEGCASLVDNAGDLLPTSLLSVLVTARPSPVVASEVWLEIQGPEGLRSYACSLPDTSTLRTIESQCRVRAR